MPDRESDSGGLPGAAGDPWGSEKGAGGVPGGQNQAPGRAGAWFSESLGPPGCSALGSFIAPTPPPPTSFCFYWSPLYYSLCCFTRVLYTSPHAGPGGRRTDWPAATAADPGKRIRTTESETRRFSNLPLTNLDARSFVRSLVRLFPRSFVRSSVRSLVPIGRAHV